MTHNTKAGKIILETIPLRTKKSAVGLAQAAGRDNLAAVRRRATDAHLRKMEKAAAKQAVLDKSPGKKKSDEGVEPPAKKTKKTSTLKLTQALAEICGRKLRSSASFDRAEPENTRNFLDASLAKYVNPSVPKIK